jgi:hypothetical protein
MNPAIKKFLDSTPFARRAMIRCGFELETQATESNCDDQEIDHESADEAIREEAEREFNEIPRNIRNALCDSTVDDVINDLQDRIRDSFDYSDYMQSNDDALQDQIDNAIGHAMAIGIAMRDDNSSSKVNKPKIQCGKDGSVDGYEFRTIGALTYAQFVIASRAAFSLDHTIDEACSFHVHLSIPGVKHSYGDRFQLALVEYLIENIGRIPQSVRSRWKGAPSNQYIKGLLSSKNKYSFVYAHEQGTWEFRCFGNVLNTKDGLTCLNIAIEAMAHAYQVTQQSKSLLTDSYDGDLCQLFEYCLSYSMPVSKRLREIRMMNKFNKSAQSA